MKTSMVLKKTTLLTAILCLSACSTMQDKKETAPYYDQEPGLFNLPVRNMVDQSKKSIQEDLDLLQILESGKPVDSYKLVTHVQNHDARVGSLQTVPEVYAFPEKVAARKKAEAEAALQAQKDAELQKQQQEVMNANLQKFQTALKAKVNLIQWLNRSSNEFGELLAKNLNIGSQFYKNKEKDVKVNMLVKNGTLEEAFVQFSQQMAPHGQVGYDPQKNLVYIIYK